MGSLVLGLYIQPTTQGCELDFRIPSLRERKGRFGKVEVTFPKVTPVARGGDEVGAEEGSAREKGKSPEGKGRGEIDKTREVRVR